MSKNMLIDSAHLEEIRVAVVDDERLEKFDFEVLSKAQVKGNIYLAKIVRVEPSLQAAFVDYGNERCGFLSFSEIHNDYFQIPVGDRHDLERHIQNAISALSSESDELDPKEISRLRYQFYRRYKIQEVIKKRQIILVQVVKEERGNKGAALTTYISLAGRYCVVMPNTAKGSGVSRKVLNHSDRNKLKKIVSGLLIENGSVVIRTAGVGCTRAEITKDFNYLKKLWDEIRETTLKSTAPCLIHEEDSIIKRSIRDLYGRDIDNVFVEGTEGYDVVKSFMRKIMPNHAKKVILHEDKTIALFSKFKINEQIDQIYSTKVSLPSGGYLVINPTEALTSIDVNSGKSIRGRDISQTAVGTNLEAAKEIARQCVLRDLAGLIVVDFIDMEEKHSNACVEKCLRDSFREDKAKIQVGTISNFGLLEFSRQRLRPSIMDLNTKPCPYCNGSGSVWLNESIAIQILRKIEESIDVMNGTEIEVTISSDAALLFLNSKREFISTMEEKAKTKIHFKIDNTILASDFKIEHIAHPVTKTESDEITQETESTNQIEKRRNKPVLSKEKLLTKYGQDDLSETSSAVVSVANEDKLPAVGEKKIGNGKNEKCVDNQLEVFDISYKKSESKKNKRNNFHLPAPSTVAFGENSGSVVVAPEGGLSKSSKSDVKESANNGRVNNKNSSLSEGEGVFAATAIVQNITRFMDKNSVPVNLPTENNQKKQTAGKGQRNIWWRKLLKKQKVDGGKSGNSG